MKTGPKYKICKRLGNSVFEKCQTQKFMLSEARTLKSSRRRRRKTLSDYGRQLIEKQKLRYTYGISERQLANYVKEAVSKKGVSPMEKLFENLELRLDNVVYQLGLAHTRGLSRQMTSHGHILINGRKMTIPSHRLSKDDTIGIREGSKNKVLFTTIDERLAEHKAPAWLSFDNKKMTGVVVEKPAYEKSFVAFDMGAVLEYYSR
ncbi:30S ribosomal protein S4 [Patescibacteria group bacterium]|nr:30S ribosomal protein S4 [Patescibacteria group bacterium]